MRLTLVPLAIAGLALAGFAVFSQSAPGGKVEHRFRKPPVNALGVQSLSDLRGKPVLIDFWGTR